MLKDNKNNDIQQSLYEFNVASTEKYIDATASTLHKRRMPDLPTTTSNQTSLQSGKKKNLMKALLLSRRWLIPQLYHFTGKRICQGILWFKSPGKVWVVSGPALAFLYHTVYRKMPICKVMLPCGAAFSLFRSLAQQSSCQEMTLLAMCNKRHCHCMFPLQDISSCYDGQPSLKRGCSSEIQLKSNLGFFFV